MPDWMIKLNSELLCLYSFTLKFTIILIARDNDDDRCQFIGIAKFEILAKRLHKLKKSSFAELD